MPICGGQFSVWAFVDTAGSGNKDQTNYSGLEWLYLRHTDQWAVVPDIQEAPRKRTSSTGGRADKLCPDIIGFDIEVTNTIEQRPQWLYGAILDTPASPGIGVTAWFFLGFDARYNPDGGTGADQAIPGKNKGAATGVGDNPLHIVDQTGGVGVNEAGHEGQISTTGYTWAEPGFYVYGTVVPPGFTGNNDGQDATTGDWTINVTQILYPTPANDSAAPYYFQLPVMTTVT